jgi:hypothetical protein
MRRHYSMIMYNHGGNTMHSHRRPIIFLILIMFLSVPCIGGGGDSGPRAAYTTQTVFLYDLPAELVTGVGWRYGRVMYKLPANTQIFIYKTRNIGFGAYAQSWCYVSFWHNGWKYGWIRRDFFQYAMLKHAPRRCILDVFIGTAYAYEDLAVDVMLVEAPEGEVPPTSPPKLRKESGGNPLHTLYILSFASMILGMIGHEIIHTLESSRRWRIRDLLRRFATPVIVSPMVFLGFLEFAEFGITTNRSFLVLPLMAFQNGFFWHSVTARGVQKT